MQGTQRNDSATVDGCVVGAVVTGVTDTCGHFEGRTRRLLADAGLPRYPEEGDQYDFQRFLSVLNRIGQQTGPNTLTAIGRAVPEALSWPARVDSVGAALDHLGTVFGNVHSDSRGYTFVSTGTQRGTIKSETAYPAAFERGLLEGIGQHFGRGTGHIDIDEQSVSGGLRFELTWWLPDDRQTRIPAPSEYNTAQRTRTAALGD